MFSITQNIEKGNDIISLISLETLQKELECSYSSIWRFCNDGLPHFKRGKKLWFNKNKVYNWLEENYSVNEN
jgi:hypothetical protein